jgi:hypothetical protein
MNYGDGSMRQNDHNERRSDQATAVRASSSGFVPRVPPRLGPAAGDGSLGDVPGSRG